MQELDYLEQQLIDKIRSLPADKVAAVHDFVDFLRRRGLNRELTRSAAALSEPSFARVWDNPDDAIYDQL
jgi:hypothetical protein